LRRAISSGEQRIFKDRPRTTIGRIPVGHSPARSSQPDREIILEARIAELEADLRARDDFLAIAAHELRNPMTPIRGRVELLLAGARRMPGAVPKEIVQGLERLERLVDAYIRRATILLDVSRINSENLSLQLAEIDLSVLVRQGAMSMTPAAERAGSSISLKVQTGIIGHCDEMAVEQILENLLSNAIRYGGAQPIEVAFSSDGDNARLSVRDQGIGISDQDQAQIFERFWRLDRKSTKGGFGVGLWITRQLVHAMQGEIVVSSKPGAGSTFAVTLPLSPRQTDAH
jgi:two-component system OmpR family sensor kinase